MKAKQLGIVILVFGLLIVNSIGAAAADNGNVSVPEQVSKNTITAISVTGNQHVAEERIIEQIATQVGDSISQEQLKKDMRSIFDLGYFFDVRVNFKNHQGGVKLVFEVIENPKLSKIVINGNQKVADAKLKEKLGVKTGKLLNVNQLDKGVKAVKKYYQSQGYVLAQIVNVTIKNEDELHLEVKEGKLNKIIISGNQETKDYVIRRELDMEPGEVFNVEEMREDLRKIYNLGFFKDVKPKLKRVENNPHAANLEIKVEEKKTGTFSVGGGYSSDAGLTGLVNVRKDNLFGRGQRVNLEMEFGGKKNTYQIGYYAPWTFGTETSIDFNLYKKNKKEENEERQGGNITVGRPLAEFTKGYATLNLESIKDSEGWHDNRSITLKTVRDTRKNIINPRTGSRSEVSVEKAGILGAEDDFTKYELDARKYLPSRKENAWAFSFRLGESSGQLANYAQYSLGGMTGIRGYNEEYYKSENNPEENGFEGEAMVLGSLEYRFKIIDKVMGVSFFDAGRAFSDHLSLDDLKDEPKSSVGLGVRFNTPMGQIGADYGIALSGVRDGEKGHFSFRIGNKF